MGYAQERIAEIVSKIKPNIRPRVELALLHFLTELEEISTHAFCEYSIHDIQERESSKIETLKKLNVFPESELESDNINARGKFGYTQLHQAVANNDQEKIIELLKIGADPTLKDNSGATPYQKAINRGYDKIADILRNSITE